MGMSESGVFPVGQGILIRPEVRVRAFGRIGAENGLGREARVYFASINNPWDKNRPDEG
jgi:hypothetical protein